MKKNIIKIAIFSIVLILFIINTINVMQVQNEFILQNILTPIEEYIYSHEKGGGIFYLNESQYKTIYYSRYATAICLFFILFYFIFKCFRRKKLFS